MIARAAHPGSAQCAPGSGPRVLIGFAEAWAAPEVCWSLIDAGCSVAAFNRQGRRPALARSRHADILPVHAPERDAQECVEQVRRAYISSGAACVLPLDDYSLWVCDQAFGEGDRREGSGPAVVGPPRDCIPAALDKRTQLRLARAAGFSVPPTAEFALPSDLSPDSLRRAGIDFPCVVKQALAVYERDGRLLRRSPPRVITDPAELSTFLAKAPPMGPILVQPLIHGEGYGLFGLATDRGIHNWSGHRRLRMMNPAGSGSSACESVGTDPLHIARATDFLGQLSWRGLFMFELLRDRNATFWFMELNGRPWGSMALARRAGLEYPAWAVRSAMDPGFEPPSCTPAVGVRCRHLGGEVVHSLHSLRGAPSRALREGWPRPLGTLLRVLRPSLADRWYNWRRDDWRVFVGDALDTVRSVIPRVLPRIVPRRARTVLRSRPAETVALAMAHLLPLPF